MPKHSEHSEERISKAAEIKNEYIESLKDQIQMLQDQLKGAQTQHEASVNRLMSMFEQTQRLVESQ